jgi:hypothetical protein
MYGGMEVMLHMLLTSALSGVEWSATWFSPGEKAHGAPAEEGYLVLNELIL